MIDARGSISRRRLMQALAAAGITGPAAAALLADARSAISADVLRSASSIVGETFADDRLKVIEAALQRNLDQFQGVRDLAIDDAVEPAPIFNARRR
ncbi:MAG TPA: hypothetical protein VL309_10465 [Vicinamibacterales bacterium]|jgi:hypothetical protein|nr:hypothetical protein [Vicinamibacterales bacterium]